jgi:hypothetical protein
MTDIGTTTNHHDGLYKASYSRGSHSGYTSNGSDLSIEWSRLGICCVTVRPRRLYHTAARARPRTMSTRTEGRVCLARALTARAQRSIIRVSV